MTIIDMQKTKQNICVSWRKQNQMTFFFMERGMKLFLFFFCVGRDFISTQKKKKETKKSYAKRRNPNKTSSE